MPQSTAPITADSIAEIKREIDEAQTLINEARTYAIIHGCDENFFAELSARQVTLDIQRGRVAMLALDHGINPW